MPVLGRMSDQDNSVRLMASHCFAKLVALMPLEVSSVKLRYLSKYKFKLLKYYHDMYW